MFESWTQWPLRVLPTQNILCSVMQWNCSPAYTIKSEFDLWWDLNVFSVPPGVCKVVGVCPVGSLQSHMHLYVFSMAPSASLSSTLGNLLPLHMAPGIIILLLFPKYKQNKSKTPTPRPPGKPVCWNIPCCSPSVTKLRIYNFSCCFCFSLCVHLNLWWICCSCRMSLKPFLSFLPHGTKSAEYFQGDPTQCWALPLPQLTVLHPPNCHLSQTFPSDSPSMIFLH